MSAIIHIALGSNRRHGRHGAPAAVIVAAMDALDAVGEVVARSTIRPTPPLGPRQRRFANAVAAVATSQPVADVLVRLQAIEDAFGRRPGRRWGPRVLDLDIVAAETEVTPRQWRSVRRGLIIPHRRLAVRRFVLDPLVEIAADWRHPVLHLTARQLRSRLRQPRRSPPADP